MNDPTLPTDWDRPITTDQRHYSLITNNIATKLTNQFLRSGLRTFDWQQLWNWLWCASPLPTTVLLRTAHTRTIKVHYYMLPPGLNHLLYWFPKKRVKRGQSRVQKSVQSNWRFLHQLNSVSPKRYDADNENLYGNHLAFMMFHSPNFNEKETNSGYNRSVSLLVLWNLLAKTTKSWISLSARYFTKEKRHRLTFNRWEDFKD